MIKNQLEEYRKKISELNEKENILRDLYLKKYYDGSMQGPLTGFPSLDKPWLKYYGEEAINYELPRMSAYEYLYQNNKDRLGYYALNFYGNRITYKELFNKINEAEKAFIRLGVRKGDYVTFCMPTLPETIYSFYALNKIGAVSNFIDLRMNKERILKYINDTNSKLVVSFNGVSEKVNSILEESTAERMIDVDVTDSLKPILSFLYKIKVKGRYKPNEVDCISWNKFIKNGKDIEDDEVELFKKIYETITGVKPGNYKIMNKNVGEEPAAIVYTGGTTGEPKGAVLSNNSLNTSAIQYGTADIPRGENDGFLEFMPPFIAYGLVNGIHFPLSLGMEDVLIPKFSPDDFYELLNKYKTPHFVGIPLHFEKLMNDPRAKNMDLSFIKNAGCGGDVIPADLEAQFDKFLAEHNSEHKMRTGFGMTENAAMSIYDINDSMIKVGRIGIPMQKMKIGVFDEDGNELGYNETGELRINSPAIINGYHNNEEETNHAIITVNGERWIKTGDYVSIDEDGNVKIIGRKKTMIIRPDGHNVWPDLIRNNLFSCPIVEDVCVVGVKSKYDENGLIPTAVVVLKDKTMDKEEAKNIILEYQSHLLGERDGAIDIRFRDELPLTSIGKIDSIKLTEEENKNLSDIDFATLTANNKKKVLK